MPNANRPNDTIIMVERYIELLLRQPKVSTSCDDDIDNEDDDADITTVCESIYNHPSIVPIQKDIALTSYAYWYILTHHLQKQRVQSQEEHLLLLPKLEKNAAIREIYRHYVGQQFDLDKTIQSLQTAVSYRHKYPFELLRSCFEEEHQEEEEGVVVNDDDNKKKEKLRQQQRYLRRLIRYDLIERQTLLISPIVDRYGRTVIYKGLRRCPPGGGDTQKEYELDIEEFDYNHNHVDDDDDDDNIDESDRGWFYTQLYTAERAMAVAEAAAAAAGYHNGNNNNDHQEHEHDEHDKVTLIFDFDQYDSKYSPSIPTTIKLVTVLQACYPERLGTLIMLNAPFWMRTFFRLLQPFLSTSTSSKIQLVSSSSSSSSWLSWSSSSSSDNGNDSNVNNTQAALSKLFDDNDEDGGNKDNNHNNNRAYATKLVHGTLVSSSSISSSSSSSIVVMDWDRYLSSPFSFPYD